MEKVPSSQRTQGQKRPGGLTPHPGESCCSIGVAGSPRNSPKHHIPHTINPPLSPERCQALMQDTEHGAVLQKHASPSARGSARRPRTDCCGVPVL